MENQQQREETLALNEQTEQARSQTRFEIVPPVPAEYLARVRAAFHGKDGRRILHTIKPQFPNIRTAELNMKFIMLQDGVLMDEDILKAVESVSID